MVINLSDDHKGNSFEKGMFKIGLIILSANLYQGLDAFFKEANWRALTSENWKELEMMRKVLEVCGYFFLLLILYSLLHQLPYLFQQALSFEKTPTLCHTVVAFEGFMLTLRGLQAREPEAEFIIEAGLTKLDEYYDQALLTPAYLLSVGE